MTLADRYPNLTRRLQDDPVGTDVTLEVLDGGVLATLTFETRERGRAPDDYDTIEAWGLNVEEALVLLEARVGAAV